MSYFLFFIMLDDLNKRNIKFGLSNVLEHKGNCNSILVNWLLAHPNYRINYLNKNYNTCSYNNKNKENKTVEVLITNY